ncbi:MAG: hypothetical protein JWM67_2185 [Mycobacterium sp.]|nr:hypothetical protein [Mycobacterium sp.]
MTHPDVPPTTTAELAERVRGLRSPVVVMAFAGWNDAGDAATDTVAHLHDAWGAQWLGGLDPDDYYDFQVNRPAVKLLDDEAGGPGTERTIVWPTTRFAACPLPGTDRDVLLIHGVEPNMRWRGFSEEIVSVVQASGAPLVVSLGALLADIAHTRPIQVSGSAADRAQAERMGLTVSRYEGPTGIVGVLGEVLGAAGIPVVSLWAAVPHYVSSPPSPKATLALLDHIEDLLEISVPSGDLPARATVWERTVNELASEDSDVAEYVAQLESREPTDELPEASGEAIARAFERFLRRGGGQP